MTATDIPTTETTLDEERIGAFAGEVFGAALGTVELIVASMGREFGLYPARRGQPGLTPAELATRAGIDDRYAREWLEHQAVAGVVTVTTDGAANERRYALPEEHAVALLDEEHPAYVGALAELPPIIARTLEPVLAAFRTGDGVPFADYGVHAAQAGMTRPMFANSLATEWVPALADVYAKLGTSTPRWAPRRALRPPVRRAARPGPSKMGRSADALRGLAPALFSQGSDQMGGRT